MNNIQLKRSIRGACVVAFFASSLGFGDPAPTAGNPATNASDRNYDTQQPHSAPGAAQKMEDGSNRALNKVDRGVHKAGRKTRHAAHRAKVKTENGMDKMSEPANKPQ